MEPFGIASSILQVADTGFSLAKNLYQYAQDVKNAKSEVHNIAKEIDVTSDVLRNFGDILNDENAKALCTPQLQLDAQRTLEECRAAFDDMNKTLIPFCKADGRGAIAARGRFRWPVGKSKTKAHQERLERLKSSLSLMLEIIRYARETSASPDHQVLNADRHQIENLIRSNEALVRSITSNDIGYLDSLAGHSDVSPALHYDDGIEELALSRGAHEQPRSLCSQGPPAAGLEEDSVSRQLRVCIDAAVKVTQSLNVAWIEWFTSRTSTEQKFQDPLHRLCLHVADLEKLLRDTTGFDVHPAPLVRVTTPDPQHMYPLKAVHSLADVNHSRYQQDESRKFSLRHSSYGAPSPPDQYFSIGEPIKKFDGRFPVGGAEIQPKPAAHTSHSEMVARSQSRGRRGGRKKKVGKGETSSKLDEASEIERQSFHDALDASRGIVAMSQYEAQRERTMTDYPRSPMLSPIPTPPTPVISPQPPQQQAQSLPILQPQSSPAHAKTESTFMPIDESRSLWAQHSGFSRHKKLQDFPHARVTFAGNPLVPYWCSSSADSDSGYLADPYVGTPYFVHPPTTEGAACWSSYETVPSYNPAPPQGSSTGDVQEASTEACSIRELDEIDLGPDALRPRKRRKQSGEAPIAEPGRGDSSGQVQPAQEAAPEEEESNSTEGFDAAKSLEMLWSRWTKLSPQVLEQYAAVA